MLRSELLVHISTKYKQCHLENRVRWSYREIRKDFVVDRDSHQSPGQKDIVPLRDPRLVALLIPIAAVALWIGVFYVVREAIR